MQQRTEFVRTADGSMEAFIAQPGVDPRPAVVLYHDIGGLSDATREMAKRVAAEGYCCAVPDLYYRLGKIVVDPDSKAAAVAAIRRAAAGSLQNWDTMSDTRALLDFLSADGAVRAGPRGAVGYGAGGRFAVLAAGQFAGEVGAAASMFGTGLVTEAPDSPHLMLHKMQGALYCAFAERDPMVPAAKIEAFSELVKQRCSAESLIELHPGTRDEAAAQSWERVFALFSRRLA